MMPTAMPVLSRSPVRLRAFADTDTELVRSMADDPYVPLITTVPTSGTLADALAFIARQHDRLASGRGYSFAIADEASDAAVGQVGLWVDELPRGRASIGYWMSPAARRRGYVTAALAAISDWGLHLDGLHRLQLLVEPWNEGSWLAAERVGYQREGLLRADLTTR